MRVYAEEFEFGTHRHIVLRLLEGGPRRDKPNDNPQLIDIARLWRDARDVIEAEFPGYSPRTEACVAACAALRTQIVNCPAVGLVGPSGSGKTTVTDILSCDNVTIGVDRITPAVWVANTMGKSEQELADIDLIPQVRHKLLLMSDAGAMFRGSVDQIKETFKVLTKVLDGSGLIVSTAAHGKRGYSGDYTFAWVFGTTKLPQRTWDIQAEIGSRILFYDVAPARQATAEEIQVEMAGKPFLEKVKTCNNAVKEVMKRLLWGSCLSTGGKG
jgi:energy-coupling factor transporter ATP-binding protein EcfA2